MGRTAVPSPFHHHPPTTGCPHHCWHHLFTPPLRAKSPSAAGTWVSEHLRFGNSERTQLVLTQQLLGSFSDALRWGWVVGLSLQGLCSAAVEHLATQHS